MSRRLERDLLAAGERIVRVLPKLMANCRSSARAYGKSAPIDALAVARAALREPDLPASSLDGDARELRLKAALPGRSHGAGRPARSTSRPTASAAHRRSC